MSVVLLLGAGFSKWAADLPVAKQLFDFAIEPFGPREERKLARLRAIKSHWDLTHPGCDSERFIADAVARGADHQALVLWYVQRRLVTPYIWQEQHAGRIRRHVLQIDEHRVDLRPGVAKARAFLARCNPEGIVTLNYDMLVEYALGTRRFHYGQHGEVLHGRGPYPVSRWRRPVQLTGAIPLAKLHGSISWDADSRYVDGRCGLGGRSLLVAPVPEKTPPPKLHDVWRMARDLLVKTQRILVFGLAFNPYDEAVLALLRDRADKPLDSVLLIDPAPNVSAARCLWPSAQIETSPPLPAGDSILRQWLHREPL